LKKYQNIKFHQNLFSGSQVVPCGQTDRHMWTDKQTDTHEQANSHCSWFYECA